MFRRWFGLGRIAATSLLMLSSSVFAQTIDANCRQVNPTGNMLCDLSPPDFSEWTYTSGLGGYAPTVQQAFDNTIAHLALSTSTSICGYSPKLGSQTVTSRDGFINSDAPTITATPWQISVSIKIPGGGCTPMHNSYGGTISGTRRPKCRWAGWSTFWDATKGKSFCGSYADVGIVASANSCSAVDGANIGNPIDLGTAEKVQRETDHEALSERDLSFVRIHRSNWVNRPVNLFGRRHPMSQAWSHNHWFRLNVDGMRYGLVTLLAGEGHEVHFTRADPASDLTWKSTDNSGALTRTSTGFTYRRLSDGSAMVFDAAGNLTSQTTRHGWITRYAYAGGQLATVSNAFGRRLTLTYGAAGRVQQVASSDGRSVFYSYDGAGRLSRVVHTDGKSRDYLYEDTRFPQALTGIVDEVGNRYASFTYDDTGRAVATEHAGGVQRYVVSHATAGGTARVTDPLGTLRSYGIDTRWNQLTVSSRSLTSADGSDGPAARTLDSNGLVTSERDHASRRTEYVWDPARRLPLTTIEAPGLALQRTTGIEWHPSLPVPTVITEQGRQTVLTYDARANVLSRRVIDTTTPARSTREWRFTYTAQGLVETATEPNAAVTRYSYDAFGNLLSTTNALGHVTRFSYDAAHRLVARIDPNGLTMSYAWDARNRLVSASRGGPTGPREMYVYTYAATGVPSSVLSPDGLKVDYTYDAAQRLTSWRNNRGESGTFVLDGMGNRTQEVVRDGACSRGLHRGAHDECDQPAVEHCAGAGCSHQLHL